jgi:hypothetical protein
MNKKWIGVIILGVVGVLLAIVAIEYLTEPISKVPHFLGGHHVRGHFRRRGEAAAVLAVIALAGAGYLAYTITKKPAATAPGDPSAQPTGATSQAPAAAAPSSATPTAAAGPSAADALSGATTVAEQSPAASEAAEES